MRLSVILSFLIIATAEPLLAQNAYYKLGMQSMVDRDFKSAVEHLEKACVIDSTDANAFWMLGYSYYHSASYKKSIAAYSKLLALKPADGSGYYYRARAKCYLAKETVALQEKEKYLFGAIVDFTKAIEIDPQDMKTYQNRGIAYREYGEFKLIQGCKTYDKNRGINALRASVADLEKVLNDNPSRSDIESLIAVSKEKMASVVGHH